MHEWAATYDKYIGKIDHLQDLLCYKAEVGEMWEANKLVQLPSGKTPFITNLRLLLAWKVLNSHLFYIVKEVREVTYISYYC